MWGPLHHLCWIPAASLGKGSGSEAAGWSQRELEPGMLLRCLNPETSIAIQKRHFYTGN